MFAAALALILVGLVLVLFLGYFGFIIAAVGGVILILALLGIGRRAVETGP